MAQQSALRSMTWLQSPIRSMNWAQSRSLSRLIVSARHGHTSADASLFNTKPPTSYTVAPPTAPPFGDNWMQLSSLDTLAPSVHVSALLFYTKQAMQGFRFEDVVSRLEASLSRTLVPFYPFSGRLKHNEESIWQLHLNNKGAEFNVIESELKLQDLEYYMLCSGQNMLVPSLHACEEEEEEGIPPVSIQVTRFKCGALAICCSFHHHLADAHGGTLFLKSWADMARNGARDDSDEAPIHDRTPLLLPLTPSLPRSLPMISSKRAPISFNPEQRTQVFLLDSSFIAKNKHSTMTTFETITSLLWQQIGKAQRDAGVEQDELATLCFMVNCRNVMGLPTSFIGNASVPAIATCPLKELLHQPLSYVAESIRMAKKEVTREYFMEAISRSRPLHEDASVSLDHVLVTSGTRFPIYDMDFGWGKPKFAGFEVVPPGLFKATLLYTPAPGGKGVVAYVRSGICPA